MGDLSELTQRVREHEARMDFPRLVFCLLKAVATGKDVCAIAQKDFGDERPHLANVLKTAVGGGTTYVDGSGDDWAWRRVTAEWVSTLSQRTLLGRIPFRRVDFRTRTIVEDTPGSAEWTAEGAAAPVCSMSMDAVNLDTAKVSGIAVFTKELVQVWSPATSQQINRSMLRVIGRALDRVLLDPAYSAVAGKNPASLTNGISATPSTGNTEATISADLERLLQSHADAGEDISEIVLIFGPKTALYLSRLKTSGGALAFPNLGVRGGSIWGLPVEVSNGASNVTGSPTENVIVAVNPNGILLADNGDLRVSPSAEGVIQMDNAPTGSIVTGAGTNVVSLWQTESVAALFSRQVNWVRAVDTAVSYMRVAF